MRSRELEQVLSHDKGTILVLGGPGSGKTAALVERYARLVEGGVPADRVALFVSDAAAARALRDDLILRLARSLPGVNVVTPHEFARGVIDRRFSDLGYQKPPRVLDAAEQESLVRELLAGEEPAAWPACAQVLRVPGFARQIARFILRLREQAIDPDHARKLSNGTPHLEEPARFYDRYLRELAERGALDSASLLPQAIAGLHRTGEEGFDHVLIDDYEEASLAMESLRNALEPSARSMVVAADPGGGPAQNGSGLLDALPRELVVALPDRESLAATLNALEPAVPTPLDAPPQNIEARLFAHPGEEADAIAHELAHAHVADRIPWGAMAVIVRRYGANLAPIRHALARHHVPFVAGSSDVRLIDEPAVEPLVTMLRFVGSPKDRDLLLDRVLSSPIIGCASSDVRALRRQARIASTTAVEQAFAQHELLCDIVRETESLGDDAVEAFWTLYRRASYVKRLIDEQSHQDLDALVSFTDALDFKEKLTIPELLESVREITARAAIDRYPNAVKLLSVRDARSRSFELVIVANCVEGEFPSTRAPRLLIDPEDLLNPQPQIERVKQRFEHERKLFRRALTRARTKTYVFASRSASSANPRTPSRFVEQRLGLRWQTSTPPHHAEATSKRNAQADLRAIARDPGSSHIEQLAALEALRRTGEDARTWWGVHEWTEPGAPMLEDDAVLKTSYSKISAMNECGLKYLYQVELGLDPDQSYQMWVGSTVHEIIDRAQRELIELTEAALHEALDELWDPAQFPNRAIEHRRYLDCKRMLTSWLREESSAPVIASEVEFAYPIHGAVVRGKIDAIKRMKGDKLRIVDYKTGTYPPTKNEVKKDLQLASYYLATKKVDELAAFGEPGSLQLAYIAKPSADHEITWLEVAPADVEPWAEQKLVDLTQLVRGERFAPNPEADCTFCKFRQLCPMWPEGSEAAL